MATTPGRKANAYIASLPSLSATNEATTDVGGTHLIYQVTNAARRYLDKDATTTVQTSADGSTGWTTITTGFTINYVGGKVLFAVAQPPAPFSVRFSAMNYFTMAALLNAKAAKLSSKLILQESTDFAFANANGAHRYDAIDNTHTITLDRWQADKFFLDYADKLLIIQLYVNLSVGTRWESYARLTDDSIDFVRAGLIDEALTFQGEGDLNFVP